jgi:hypothetical protein
MLRKDSLFGSAAACAFALVAAFGASSCDSSADSPAHAPITVNMSGDDASAEVNAECHCPVMANQEVLLPSGVSADQVDAVSTDGHCAACSNTTDNAIYVTMPNAASCVVVAHLRNGRSLSSTVSFVTVGGCCGFGNIAGASAFESAPAADGGSTAAVQLAQSNLCAPM